MNPLESLSLRPYFIRAVHEWCSDQGLTPYMVVLVDDSVQVPVEYVQNGQIVLNVDIEATSGLTLDNEYISFQARFGGVPREVIVPVDRVLAIYARENGQGMAFPVVGAAPDDGLELDGSEEDDDAFIDAPAVDIQLVPSSGAPESSDDGQDPPTPPPARKRPALKRVK